MDEIRLDQIKVKDLRQRKELIGIQKTNITNVLREYKQRNKKNLKTAKKAYSKAKESMENTRNIRLVFQKNKGKLDQQDIEILRNLIEQHKTKKGWFSRAEESELNTLKSALAYARINAEVIMTRYEMMKREYLEA